MTKELLQQALDALVECCYATTDKSEKLADAAIAALESAIAQPAQSSALSKLLFEIDTQAGNGFIPWQIEDAYAEYIASVAQPVQPAAKKAPARLNTVSVGGDRIPLGEVEAMVALLKAQRNQMRDAIDAAITANKGAA